MSKTLQRRPFDADVQVSDNPLVNRIFAARGVVTREELGYSLKSLPAPALMKGMEGAVTLLVAALQAERRLLVVGDFDADGATSTALLVGVLRAMGGNVQFIVPNRFEFGYGLTPAIVDAARPLDPEVIITVDNGISSADGVAHARALGLDVVVTDHHLPPAVLPAANAILDPHQPGCTFPGRHIAGVGVAFYLLLGLRTALRAVGWFADRAEPNLAAELPLVALGTIADVVPMDYVNRILVAEGLKRLRQGAGRPGLRALVQIAGAELAGVTSENLAFGVGPRLNAAGRLDDMSLGINCLLTHDEVEAQELAQRLDALNRERREIERDMREQAEAHLAAAPAEEDGRLGVTLYHDSWHQGVVGIVASRIKEKFGKPVIAFAKTDQGELKGSGRSVPGLHLRDALDAIASANPGMLDKFGGHAAAAGLSLAPELLADFARAFDAEVRRWLAPEDLAPRILSDGPLTERVAPDFVRNMMMGQPWGHEFPAPLFDGRFDVISQRIVGGKHLKLKLRSQDTGQRFDGIAFNRDRTIEGSVQHLAYRLSVNAWRGLESVELIIEELDLHE